MRGMIEQYARTIIAVVIGVFLIGMCTVFLFQRNDALSLGDRAEADFGEVTLAGQEKNRAVYAEIARQPKPVFSYIHIQNTLHAVMAKESVPVSDCVQAADYEGRSIYVEVLDIFDENGQSRLDIYQKSDETLTFPKEGVYTLVVRAVDDCKKTCKAEIAVPVEKRLEGRYT